MRQCLVLTVTLMVVACGGSSTKAPATAIPADPSTSNLEPADAPEARPALTPAEAQAAAVTEYAAAWVAYDVEKAASFYTEDAVVKMVGAPDAVGREAIAATIAGTFEGAGDGQVPFTRTFTSGEVVVGEWAWTGTHTGNLMGLPATNKPFGLMGVSIYFFTPDAKLKEVHGYFDGGTLMSHLGLSKADSRPVVATPAESTLSTTATDSADEERNADAARGLFAAFDTKKEADFIASMHDAIVWEDMTRPEAMTGKAAAKKYFKMMTKAFPDMKVEVQNLWSVGNVVIVESTMSGTHKGPLGPIRATKKSVNLHHLDIIEFDADGMIERGRSYSNSGELAMQLGLMPAPAAAAKN